MQGSPAGGFFGMAVAGDGQPVKVPIAEGTTLRICQAALPASANGRTVLSITVDGQTFCLGTLDNTANVFQIPLELVITSDQQLSFSAQGTSSIHVSGFVEPTIEGEDTDDDDLGDNKPSGESSDYDDSDDDYQAPKQGGSYQGDVADRGSLLNTTAMPHPTIQHPTHIARILLFASRTNLECWTLGGVTSTWKQTVEPGEYGGIGARIWNNLLPSIVEEMKRPNSKRKQRFVWTDDPVENSLDPNVPGLAVALSFRGGDINRQEEHKKTTFRSLPFHEVEAIGSMCMLDPTDLDMTGFKNLKSIGSDFCADITFESVFHLIDFSGLKNVKSIGWMFLSPCRLIKRLVFGEGFSSVEVIDGSFLADTTIHHLEGMEYFTGVKTLEERFMNDVLFEELDEDGDEVEEPMDVSTTINLGSILQNLEEIPESFFKNPTIAEVTFGTKALKQFKSFPSDFIGAPGERCKVIDLRMFTSVEEVVSSFSIDHPMKLLIPENIKFENEEELKEAGVEFVVEKNKAE